jgi:two-component system, NarL family, sensor histidine kinase DevS
MDGESSPARPRDRTRPEPGLDGLLNRPNDPEQGVVDVQARLRALLRANQAVVGDLSLPVLLRRIVEAACELAGARYAAIGIVDESGGLEQFVHAGVSEEVAAGMDHLPEGKGLLGALIADPRPIRLTRLGSDPRSVGFPPGHPPMAGFLGVPIRVRDEVFGNLYLTESSRGEFTAEDEELVLALAATAGVAIENARLYEESRRRQDWLQASTEVTQRLLATDGEEPLRLITRHAQRIADADIVTVVVPTPSGENASVEVATRPGAEELTGRISPLAGILVKRVLATGQPVEVADVEAGRGSPVVLDDTATLGTVMALPLGGQGRLLGALVIGRVRGKRAFTPAELEMASTFAGHATVAMELADARVAQQRIARLEDRNRIARDLHDHVIQRLYAIGLTVQSVATGARPREASGRLDRVVTDLDETMRQIRASIFHLRGPLGPETGSVRAQLLRVAADVTPLLGFDAHVRFIGPVEGVVPDDLKDDLVAVLREALANTARHAHADRVEVELTTSPTELTLEVTDNGVGIGDTARRSGLDNLRQRAQRREGSLLIACVNQAPVPPAHEGTQLRWTVPLP